MIVMKIDEFWRRIELSGLKDACASGRFEDLPLYSFDYEEQRWDRQMLRVRRQRTWQPLI